MVFTPANDVLSGEEEDLSKLKNLFEEDTKPLEHVCKHDFQWLNKKFKEVEYTNPHTFFFKAIHISGQSLDILLLSFR